MAKGLSIAVVSRFVGDEPQEISYSFIFDEVYRLAQKGIDVYVIRNKLKNKSQSDGMNFYGLEKIIDSKVFVFTLKNLNIYPKISLARSPLTIYWENLYAARVMEVVRDNKCDLIHAHFAYPEGLIGFLANKHVRKPLVVTVHGYDILTEPSIGYGARLNKKLDYIIRKVLYRADAVITASSATYKEALKIVGNKSKLFLIPNGVDIERFNPKIDGLIVKKKLNIEDKFVVFTLRNHEPKYGLEYLIRAAKIVLKKRKDVVFVIGGDGSLRNFHERLAESLGIKEYVIFTGRIPQSEVPYYYATSDVVVVPSLQEAFGLVITEAMACGKPVVATKVGGIPDQITDGYNGFLVKPRDPEGIADRILWLLENPQEARLMGSRGRMIVEEKFDINKRIEKLYKLYLNLLESYDSLSSIKE